MESAVWQQYKTKGVQVLGLNVWDQGNIRKIVKFTRDHKVTYPVVIDKDEKVYAAYTSPAKPRGVPGNAVIDKNGVIVYLSTGFDEQGILKAVDAALQEK